MCIACWSTSKIHSQVYHRMVNAIMGFVISEKEGNCHIGVLERDTASTLRCSNFSLDSSSWLYFRGLFRYILCEFLLFFHILFEIKEVIPSFFLAVIMLHSCRTIVVFNRSKFCPTRVVFHSALGLWWYSSWFLFWIVYVFIFPIWWLLDLKWEAPVVVFESSA